MSKNRVRVLCFRIVSLFLSECVYLGNENNMYYNNMSVCVRRLEVKIVEEVKATETACPG